MALADRQILLNQRLRASTEAAVRRIWGSLPDYNRPSLEGWLAQVVPVVLAAQRQEVALTTAYLEAALDRPVVGVDPAALIGSAARAGTPPEEVYTRPFIHVWQGLSQGRPYVEAVNSGLARAVSSAVTDVQLSMRETLRAVGDIDPEIAGFQRVADGDACDYCLMLDGAQFRTSTPMPIHNFCVTGDTEVWSAVTPTSSRTEPADFTSAQAATRRWYSGEVIVIKTALGHKLTVTPNHPILTDSGWVVAGELHKGQQVFSGSGAERVVGRVPDEQKVPARIEDYFGSGRGGTFVSVPFASEQFHGDIGQGEVDVVAINGSLSVGQLAALVQPQQETSFASRLTASVCLSCLGRFVQPLRAGGFAAKRGVSRGRAGFAFRGGLGRSRNPVLFGGGSFGDAVGDEVGVNRSAAESNNGRDLIDRLAGFVKPDHILEFDRIGFSGHVYNLVTSSGWYAANGILTHNCGCGVEPVVYTRGFANRNNLQQFNADKAVVPDGVAVNAHGELGPVLGSPDEQFTRL